MAFPQIGNGRMLLHEMFTDFFRRKLNHCTDDVFVCPFYDFYESELVLKNFKQECRKTLTNLCSKFLVVMKDPFFSLISLTSRSVLSLD